MKYVVMVLIALAIIITFNNQHVDRFAKDFVTEQLSNHKISGWSSMETTVPMFSLFLSDYTVMVQVRKPGQETKYVPTRVTGSCVSSCVIELSSFDFIQLR